MNNITQVSIFGGLGFGYTKHTVVDEFYNEGEVVSSTVRIYHTVLFLCIKLFWVTGDPTKVNLIIEK